MLFSMFERSLRVMSPALIAFSAYPFRRGFPSGVLLPATLSITARACPQVSASFGRNFPFVPLKIP